MAFYSAGYRHWDEFKVRVVVVVADTTHVVVVRDGDGLSFTTGYFCKNKTTVSTSFYVYSIVQ